MDEKIRIGILGGGGILGAHAPGYRKMAEDCRVVAVAEPVPEKEDRIRQLLGNEFTIYRHYEDLLERAEVDAVDIILPHDLHLPATMAAAGSVKHIQSLPERMQGETLGVILAQMESGALAQLSINWMTRSGRDRILNAGTESSSNALWYEMVQVCGTRGEAYYMAGKGTFVMAYEGIDVAAAIPCEEPVPEGGFARVKTGDWTGHEQCIAEWVKMMCGAPAKVITSGREVRGTVEVAEAAYRAAATGRTIHLPIAPTPWK